MLVNFLYNKSKKKHMNIIENLKEVTNVLQKVKNVDLHSKLIEISNQALEMQSKIEFLTKENHELKKKQDIESKIKRNDELYFTLDNDHSVFYCTYCWDNEQKLIQVRKNHGKFVCPHCEKVGIYNRDEYSKTYPKIKLIGGQSS